MKIIYHRVFSTTFNGKSTKSSWKKQTTTPTPPKKKTKQPTKQNENKQPKARLYKLVP